MLVVFFLICVNHSRYLISQTFISPIERRIIILCGSFMYMIPFIHQFDYICWYPGISPFLQTNYFKRSVLCANLLKCRFPFVPWWCSLEWIIAKTWIRLNVMRIKCHGFRNFFSESGQIDLTKASEYFTISESTMRRRVLRIKHNGQPMVTFCWLHHLLLPIMKLW